ncbi:MAG TPA: hypothetical protein VMV74_06150, partial [Bacteroidales bacterium]|nr:hypothetical protein [Bacteroidales bacterium]
MVRSGILSVLSAITISLLILLTSCEQFKGLGFSSSWERYPDSRWVGPDLWANRLSDWEIKDSRLSCTSTLPMRTVHLTSGRISGENGSVSALVEIKRNTAGTMNPEA